MNGYQSLDDMLRDIRRHVGNNDFPAALRTVHRMQALVEVTQDEQERTERNKAFAAQDCWPIQPAGL